MTVSGSRVQGWQFALQSAVTLLNQVPAPLIFPPPPFVTFINGAVAQINQALATLNTIPVVAPLIFPPQPGQATIPLETLQTLINDLQQAIALLIQALQTA